MRERGHPYECPYGAEDRPEPIELRRFDEEIAVLRESVASLDSTVRIMTYVMGILITASTGIGVLI